MGGREGEGEMATMRKSGTKIRARRGKGAAAGAAHASGTARATVDAVHAAGAAHAADTACAAAGAALPGVRLSAEVAECFRAWFRRSFVNERAGRIGHTSYERAGALDDACGQGGGARGMWYADAYERALLDHTKPLTFDEAGFLLRNPLVAMQLALGVTDLRGLRCLRRGLTHEINRLQQRAARSRYYAADNARRRRLAAERRRITRRRTTSPCPTPDEFREAFAHARDSDEARLRFGGMVHDLECHVDNCLRFGPDGGIVGRNGGIRAWIAANAPELSPKYKTIMRYKALARHLRQAVGLRDPVPTSAVLPSAAFPAGQAAAGTAAARECPPADAASAAGDRPRDAPQEAVPAPRSGGDGVRENSAAGRGENYYAVNSHIEAARRMVAELLAGGEGRGTTQGLFERVERLLSQ